MKPTFFLTTPIYYPNARPHVGSAYTTIVCDVLARYKRMCGYDVAFLTGTDEHGEKLERAATAAGVSPAEFVAEKRKLFVALWEKLGIPVKVYPESDQNSLRFIYTDHPDHVKSVQRLLIRARENGYIFSQRYEGRYCVWDERYVSDNTDPVDCDICGRPAELISEDNYFFKLSAFEQRLLELYERHPDFVKPDYRMNEVKSFVKSGLRDISVSRSRLKWGIPWPDDPHQVVYVWYDALTSYMTGIGYAQGENGSNEFRKYWRNKPGESEIVHMIGKDILRFHAVYWPAFITAAYPDQPEMLPTSIFAHGWIYYEQDKMSKSKGNVVYPEPIVEALDSLGAPGNDALRYYLLREAPFGQDTSFSYEGLIQRYNSDLANDLGNLANRTITMINSYLEGFVPPHPNALLEDDALLEIDTTRDLEREAANILKEYQKHLNAFDFSRGLEAAWRLVGLVNEYLVRNEPWVIGRQLDSSKGQYVTENRSKQLLNPILYTSAEAVRLSAVLLYPVLPHAAERIWIQLGCDQYSGRIRDQRIDELKWGGLKPGTKVGKAEPIFPRLDKAVTLAKLEELAEADRNRDKPKEKSKTVESENAKPQDILPESPSQGAPSSALAGPDPPLNRVPSSESPKISIEDFAKVEMRTGEIKTAEPIPGAKKLLKLTVDIGTEVRQVCAGIAEFYAPEKLIGMKVVIVTNLQPRKLRGVESNGMIVAASIGDEGRPVLVTFGEDVPNGARLK
ncbi:MAG TPA: methionine--tRNA ligase [Terriglobia bacterium]|nr:methionine--tRNA ligase [Terriglobia bacterium]